jgi:hypothetical protein
MSENSDYDAHLQVLQQITINLAAVTTQIAALDQIQRHTLERLVRVEERQANWSTVGERIDKIEGVLHDRLNSHSDRIMQLEARGHRLDGAGNVVDWLNKLWPIIAAAIGVIGVFLGFR